jgi:hypothetical protein
MSVDEQQLADLEETQTKLHGALAAAFEQFYTLFKKIKLNSHKDRVIKCVLKYPQNHEETVEREDEKIVAAAGMTFMQVYAEWALVNGMRELVRNEQVIEQTKQGENNDSNN